MKNRNDSFGLPFYHDIQSNLIQFDQMNAGRYMIDLAYLSLLPKQKTVRSPGTIPVSVRFYNAYYASCDHFFDL